MIKDFNLDIYLEMNKLILVSLNYSILLFPHNSRADFAKLQSANNENEIVVCSLPNTGYVWCSTPNVEPWMTRFKLFYGLDQEAQIKVVTPQEMDKYIEEYEENK